MATYGRVKVGRLTLREDHVIAETLDTDGRIIDLTGRESMGSMTGYALTLVAQRREDIMSLDGQIVPVLFDRKTLFNGYYLVKSATGSIESHDGVIAMFSWAMSLERVGTDTQIDIESRLGGAITRTNDFSVTGLRGHAPASGHIAYQTGSTIPLFTTRVSEDGSLSFYRSLLTGVNPRWGCAVSDYTKGRARFIDSTTYERSGTDATLASSGWELSNALIRVKPLASGGVFEISAYTGGAWRVKNYDILINTGPAVSIGVFDYCTIMRNTYEMVVIRLVKSLAPGRFALDLTIRRGHRFVEMYLQNDFATTIKVVRASAEVGVRPGAGGYVVANANDVNSDKYIIGSARTYTEDTTNGGISKASTTTLDAFVGIVAGGTGAVTGDAAVDLYAQYIGVPSELVRGVRR